MAGIKHKTLTTTPHILIDPLGGTNVDPWNEEHEAGATADVLTDHDKAAHDALGIEAADSVLLEGSTKAEVQTHTPASHGNTAHTSTFITAADNARLQVKKAGDNVGLRRGLNLIEGANVTLTVADDSENEEVDVTVAAAGGEGGEPHNAENYLVFLETTWKARNGDDGGIDEDDADPTVTIQYALDNLAAARAHIEKVVVRGNV